MIDLFEKLKKNRGPLGEHAKDAHGYFTFPKLEGEISNKMIFRGKEKLVWSLNNYLGLANHPKVRKADAEAAAQYDSGIANGRTYDEWQQQSARTTRTRTCRLFGKGK